MIIKTFNPVFEDFTLTNQESGSFEVTNTEELISVFFDILKIFEINNEEELKRKIREEVEEEIREEVEDEIDEKVNRETSESNLADLIDEYNSYEHALWCINDALGDINL